MGVKGKTVLHGVAFFVAVIGFVVYGFFAYDWTIEWQQNQDLHGSLLAEIFFVVDHVVFVSGLPPMLLIIYFLIMGKTVKGWSMGLVFVFLSIPVHFYVAGIAAHTEPAIYVPMQLAELAAAIGLIVYWHRKYRTSPVNS